MATRYCSLLIVLGGIFFSNCNTSKLPPQTINSQYNSLDSNDALTEDDHVITIMAAKNSYLISPHIYGTNFAPIEAGNPSFGMTLNRFGGNFASRYRWDTKYANRDADWFFENLPLNNTSDPVDFEHFVDRSRDRGMAVIGTIPIMGYLPDKSIPCSFPKSIFPEQDQFNLMGSISCGSGKQNNKALSINNPSSIAERKDAYFQQQWAESLKQSNRGQNILFYSLDNEPTWWSSNHFDIHPQLSTYDEQLDLGLEYSRAVKKGDPQAQVSGPVAAGWESYFYSAKDMHSGWGSGPGYTYWGNPIDRLAHNNTPFLHWYLKRFKEESEKSNIRLIDYLDIHGYVNPDNVSGNASDPATQQLRVRSTDVFWNPDYVCSPCSFLDGSATTPRHVVRLLPRMRHLIDHVYPGTKLAITEYNWGGVTDISGVVAQADILGILGEHGVHAATTWRPNPLDVSSPVYFAFAMYRNYDGLGSKVGSHGLEVHNPKRHLVSAYAMHNDKSDQLHVVLINRQPTRKRVKLSLLDFSGESQNNMYHYGKEDLSKIKTISAPRVINNTVKLDLDGYSIHVLVLDKK